MTRWIFRGEPHVVEAKDLALPWRGHPDGRWFRCFMCGHRFVPGDVMRSLYSNFAGSPFHGNPFVCHTPCGDGGNDAVLAELGRREKEVPWWAMKWMRER